MWAARPRGRGVPRTIAVAGGGGVGEGRGSSGRPLACFLGEETEAEPRLLPPRVLSISRLPRKSPLKVPEA